MKRLPYILLAVAAVIIAVATFIESAAGSGAAHHYIYDAVWFYALWGIIAASGLWLTFRSKNRHSVGLRLFHLAFVAILLGAVMPSETTDLHLREGMPTTTMPFALRLDSFLVDYYPDGNTVFDYRAELSLFDGDTIARPVTISMNQVYCRDGYRFCLNSFDPDLRGAVFVVKHGASSSWLTYLGYLLLVVTALACCIRKLDKRKWKALFGWGIVVVLAASLLRWFLAFPPGHSLSVAPSGICFPIANPVLRSPFLYFHVAIIITAYIMYAVAAFRPHRTLVYVATMLLAMGIAVGAMWAGVSWGTCWSWDPKEAWALITLIVYAIPLHRYSLPLFRNDRWYALYIRLALLVLLMTYFGVNTFLVGLHSYA